MELSLSLSWWAVVVLLMVCGWSTDVSGAGLPASSTIPYSLEDKSQLLLQMQRELKIADSGMSREILLKLEEAKWTLVEARELISGVAKHCAGPLLTAKYDQLRNAVMNTEIGWWRERTGEESKRMFNIYLVLDGLSDKKIMAYIDRYIEWAFDKQRSTPCRERTVIAWITFLNSKTMPFYPKFESVLYGLLCDLRYGWNEEYVKRYFNKDFEVASKDYLLLSLKHLAKVQPWNRYYQTKILKTFAERRMKLGDGYISRLLATVVKNLPHTGAALLESQSKNAFTTVTTMAKYSTPDWWLRVTSDGRLNTFNVFEVILKLTAQKEYGQFLDEYLDWASGKLQVCDTRVTMALFEYFYRYRSQESNKNDYRAITEGERSDIYFIVCSSRYGWTTPDEPDTSVLLARLLATAGMETVEVEFLKSLLRIRVSVSYVDEASMLGLVQKLVAHGWTGEAVTNFLKGFTDEKKSYVEAMPAADRNTFVTSYVESAYKYATAEWWAGMVEPFYLGLFNIFKVFESIRDRPGFVAYMNVYKVWLNSKPRDLSCTPQLAVKTFLFCMKLTGVSEISELNDTDMTSVQHVFDIVCDKRYRWTPDALNDLVNGSSFSKNRAEAIEVLRKGPTES